MDADSVFITSVASLTMAQLYHTPTSNSFYAGFRADDTLIEINPKFDYPHRLVLLSSLPVGPFQAGLPCTVPLWLAMYLQQRSLAEIVWPSWLTAENLADLVAYEKSHAALWADTSRLPPHYYECGRRLLGLTPTTSAAERTAVSLLLQDLLEVRVDKLRQQFQMLLSQETKTLTNQAAADTYTSTPAPVLDLMVAVTGIGTQELAILQPVVQQALNDQQVLRRRPLLTTSATEDATQRPSKTRDPKSSKASLPSDVADGPPEDTENHPPGAATEKPGRTRVPLRRFRK